MVGNRLVAGRCVGLTLALNLATCQALFAQRPQNTPPTQTSAQARSPHDPSLPSSPPTTGTQRQVLSGPPSVRLALPGQSSANRAAPPSWWPLPPQQQDRVQKLLAFWEAKTKDIETFRCRFKRFEHDPVFGPKDAPKSISEGRIFFARPDRGRFEEELVKHYTPPKKEGESPTYEPRPGVVGECWVCDGKSVYEYRANQKTVVEIKLPSDMQGDAISNSPLPFLFGAKAEELNRRYWIRELPPLRNVKAYRLEAVPRSLDANDFLRAEILLSEDEKDFLPVAMKLEKTRHQDGTISYSAFTFEDRQVNSPADKVANFMQMFVEPKVPWGWKRVVEDYRDAPAGSQAEIPSPTERK